MSKWRYAVLSGAALVWAGCSDLPSFPATLGQNVDNGGGNGGGSSNAGSSNSTAGTSVVPQGGSTDTGGTGTAAGTGPSGGSSDAGTSNGGSQSGGSGTTAGTNAGGSGGMTMVDPQAEIDDAVKNLKAWRFENPCKASKPGCQPDDICWEDSVNSSTAFQHASVIQIGGTPGHQYDVTLRIRGVIEPRDYPKNCVFLEGGNSQNGETISVIKGCDGFTNAGSVTFNIWQFKIAEPKETYYFNAVKTHPGHRVDTIDQTFTIRVAGGTKIDWSYDDLNGGQIRNCSNTVAGIAPYPAVYDGQYFQLDVTDAKLVP